MCRQEVQVIGVLLREQDNVKEAKVNQVLRIYAMKTKIYPSLLLIVQGIPAIY